MKKETLDPVSINDRSRSIKRCYDITNFSKNLDKSTDSKADRDIFRSNFSNHNKTTTNNNYFYTCIVHCLDGKTITAVMEKHSPGEHLLDEIIDKLGVTQKEYLGLQYVNKNGVTVWLNKNKHLKHQFKTYPDVTLYIKIKFYDLDPNDVEDIALRHLIYLQLRDDVTTGKLRCNERTDALLGSYAAQAELGDFDARVQENYEYLNELLFVPYKTEEILEKVKDLHRDHFGQCPEKAESNFLKVVKKTPRYGVDVHLANDAEGEVCLCYYKHFFEIPIAQPLLVCSLFSLCIALFSLSTGLNGMFNNHFSHFSV